MSSIEWLAACLTPWAVAPHPNFSKDAVTPAGLLALVTEMRLVDLDQHIQNVELDSDEKAVILGARDCLTETTHADGMRALEQALRSTLPAHARGAAALYLAFAHTQDGSREAALSVLTSLRDTLDRVSEDEPTALLRATLNLHIALRTAERRLPINEHVFRTANAALRDAGTESIPEFAVSLSLGWDSARVYRDMVERLVSSAVSLEHQAGVRPWVDVMQLRPPWAETRALYVQTRRDGAFLREVYDNTTSSTSRSVTFSADDSVESAAYSALLVAELAADYAEVQAARRHLARIYLVRLPRPAADSTAIRELITREAVSLLSDTTETQALRKSLRWLRANGSATGLRDAAHRSIDRMLAGEPLNANDLEVVIATPDLIDERRGKEFVLFLLEQFRATNGDSKIESDWVLRDRGWRAIARLTNGSGLDDRILTGLLQYLARSTFDEVESKSHVAVLDALSEDAQHQHADEAGAIASRLAGERAADQLVRALTRFRTSQRGNEPRLAESVTLDDIADLINEGNLNLSDDLKDSCRRVLTVLMAQIRKSALAGSISLGGSDAPAVAAAWVCNIDGNRTLIDQLVAFLTDNIVDGSQKAGALDQLVKAHGRQSANEIVDLIRGEWSAVANSPRRHPWIQGEAFPVFASALRVALAFQIGSPTELMPQVMQLSASPEADVKVEAIETLAVAGQSVDDPSAYVTILLQLAEDTDASVRAKAAQALTLIDFVPELLGSVLIDKLSRLLVEDSISVPLTIIHGFQQPGSNAPEVWAAVRPILDRISQAHPSRVVSQAARIALENHMTSPSHGRDRRSFGAAQ